jgi:predicted transcriptional regulator
MSTTSLKLSDDLKKRAADAAQQLGVSPHAFMISAIEQAATAAEQRARFVDDARSSRIAMVKSGQGYEADKVHAFIKARVAGKKIARPKARSWRD